MIADLIPKLAGMEQESSSFSPRPSLAGRNRCLRQMVYWALGIPQEKRPDRAELVFDDGRWHEELTLDWLRKSAYKVHSEQMEVTLPAPMKKGKIDALLTSIMGEDILLEHKAINRYRFEAYADGDELPYDYFDQMVCYSWGLQTIQPEIKTGILLLKCKDTAAYLEYIVSYDKTADILLIKDKTDHNGRKINIDKDDDIPIGRIIKRFNLVLEGASKKTLPKRDYDFDDWHCQYCQFRTRCWESAIQEFQQLVDGEELTQDANDLIAHYCEVRSEITAASKEKDGLAKQIKDILKKEGVKSGRAGDYIVRLLMKETSRLNKDLLLPNEIERATVKQIVESLDIKKIKKEVKDEQRI